MSKEMLIPSASFLTQLVLTHVNKDRSFDQHALMQFYLYMATRTPCLINQKRKTSNVQNLTHLGHEHRAPDHEATQPMMGY
jgi:hypothetical protein